MIPKETTYRRKVNCPNQNITLARANQSLHFPSIRRESQEVTIPSFKVLGVTQTRTDTGFAPPSLMLYHDSKDSKDVCIFTSVLVLFQTTMENPYHLPAHSMTYFDYIYHHSVTPYGEVLPVHSTVHYGDILCTLQHITEMSNLLTP